MTDYLKEARKAKREGDYSKAGDLFYLAGEQKSALECYVAGNHLFLAARLLEKTGDLKSAARYYIQCGKHLEAAEIYANKLHDFRTASLMYEKHGDLGRASEMAERGGEIIRAALMAEQADFKERAANLYLRAKKYERAAEVYFRHLKQLLSEKQEKGFLDSHQTRLHKFGNAAGLLYLRLKNYDKAAYCFEETEHFDKAAECYALAGQPEKAARLYHRLQEYDKAYQVLSKLGEKAQNRELMGDVCFQLKRFSEAADFYLLAGRPVQAAEALEQGKELHRAALLFENAEDYDRAADIYLQLNEKGRAAELFEKAKNLTYAARLYEETGRIENAIACLTTSGQSLRAAQLLIKRDEMQQAVAVLQGIPPDHDDHTEACALLGTLFYGMGMYSVAIQKFQEAIGNRPIGRDNMDVYYEMALAWEKANYYSKAREIYEKVLAIQWGYRDALGRLDRIKTSNLIDGASDHTSSASTKRILAGRYELMERLSRDAFGQMYKAQDTSLGRTVMIRRLPEQDENITRSLVEQTRVVSALTHSNILAIYDSGKDGNVYFICTEFVDGPTLRDHLAKQHPDVSEICEIATQTCLGLAYAHKKGVLHRCLAPENIYVGAGTQVKIANFGFDTKTERSSTLITKQYLSPEQILGQKPDVCSDLYSFGVVLYEMLYGAPPFSGQDVENQHLKKMPVFQESSQRWTPTFLVKIIQKCMEKDRQMRYQSADEIVEELEVADIVPGMVLNERYEIIKELGTGGMGHVYQARDRDLDEIVALKVLRAEISADPIIQKRFTREIKVARMITHPNVVKVFDIGKYKGNRYISMEFIQGTSLDEWLKTHPNTDIRVLLSILAKVIQGVQAAHTQGIMHRDLKPQNVILDRSLNPRVLDFGIARSKENMDATSSGQILGSPKYMSPEQIQGKDLDIRTDIYSLGIMMFLVFTGQEPFTGDEPRAIIMKHLTQPPPDMLKINPGIPAWLERVVMKAMEKDRNQRYASLKEMLDDLRRGYENLR